jgi:hypothetical protein
VAIGLAITVVSVECEAMLTRFSAWRHRQKHEHGEPSDATERRSRAF